MIMIGIRVMIVLQEGQRYNIAIRNDYITIGRNFNKADYFTNDTMKESIYIKIKLMLMKVIGTILELVTKWNLVKI